MATVELRRRRQELRVAFSGDLALWRLTPGTVTSLAFPKYSLDEATTFEVTDQTLFLRIDGDKPFFGVNIEAKQLEATTFDLTVSDEQFVASAGIPGLESPFEVQAPSPPAVVEELFQTRPGAGVRTRVNLTWSPSDDAFVTSYLVSYKQSANSDFIFLPETPDTSITILDLAPGTYDFQVQAINSLGLKSEAEDARRINVAILGLAAPPSAPANFSGQVVSDTAVLLRWDRSLDLDVTEGGEVEVRHETATSAAVEQDSIFLDGDVGGQTSMLAPFKIGTYFLYFIDSSGQRSDSASFAVVDHRPVTTAQDVSLADIGGYTIQEDDTFPSTDPNNTLVFDTDHLELPDAETWDDEADVDAIADIDEVGGGGVAPSGVYFFSQDLELAAQTRTVIETEISIEVFDSSTSIDTQPNFDDILNVDLIAAATLEPGLVTARIEVRTSIGTVASDTFGAWIPVSTAIFNARSYQFRIVAESFSSTTNMRVMTARVRLRSVPLG
jgi:hypothetical protein